MLRLLVSACETCVSLGQVLGFKANFTSKNVFLKKTLYLILISIPSNLNNICGHLSLITFYKGSVILLLLFNVININNPLKWVSCCRLLIYIYCFELIFSITFSCLSYYVERNHIGEKYISRYRWWTENINREQEPICTGLITGYEIRLSKVAFW